MRSRRIQAALAAVVVVLVLVVVSVARVGSRNEHISDCNTMINYWSSYIAMSDEAFTLLYDKSVPQEEAQRNALTKIEAMISFEESAVIPKFARPLVDS